MSLFVQESKLLISQSREKKVWEGEFILYFLHIPFTTTVSVVYALQ